MARTKNLPPAVIYREAVRAALAATDGSPADLPEAVTELIEGVADLVSITTKTSNSMAAFADWIVDENDPEPPHKSDPAAFYSKEEWDILNANVAWYALYADTLHGAAVAADLRRAGGTP